jgi:hypothetical protein
MQSDRDREELEAAIHEIADTPNFSFVKPTADQEYNERATMRAFVETLKADLGIQVGSWGQLEKDPPDMFMNIDEKRLGVEITILVKEELMRKRARLKKYEESGQQEGCPDKVEWKDVYWSKEKFQERLRETINKKFKKYAGRNGLIDILLVAESESALSFEDVPRWLAEMSWKPHGCIKSAYYLAAYVPRVNKDGSGEPKALRIFGEALSM